VGVIVGVGVGTGVGVAVAVGVGVGVGVCWMKIGFALPPPEGKVNEHVGLLPVQKLGLVVPQWSQAHPVFAVVPRFMVRPEAAG
jgi:hypothetical protein